MNKQDTMRPVDLVVVLALALRRDESSASYSQLGQSLGVSSSTTFHAVKRLQSTGLLRPGTHQANTRELHGFLEFGAKHVFPAVLGAEVRGVPTAHSGPALKDQFDSTKSVVWPDARGSVRGAALSPLYPKATELVEREPALYHALTLVDALRVGRVRERKAALAALDEAMGLKRAGSG